MYVESEARSISRAVIVHCLQKPITTNFLEKKLRGMSCKLSWMILHIYTHIHTHKHLAITVHALQYLSDTCCHNHFNIHITKQHFQNKWLSYTIHILQFSQVSIHFSNIITSLSLITSLQLSLVKYSVHFLLYLWL